MKLHVSHNLPDREWIESVLRAEHCCGVRVRWSHGWSQSMAYPKGCFTSQPLITLSKSHQHNAGAAIGGHDYLRVANYLEKHGVDLSVVNNFRHVFLHELAHIKTADCTHGTKFRRCLLGLCRKYQ